MMDLLHNTPGGLAVVFAAGGIAGPWLAFGLTRVFVRTR